MEKDPMLRTLFTIGMKYPSWYLPSRGFSVRVTGLRIYLSSVVLFGAYTWYTLNCNETFEERFRRETENDVFWAKNVEIPILEAGGKLPRRKEK